MADLTKFKEWWDNIGDLNAFKIEARKKFNDLEIWGCPQAGALVNYAVSSCLAKGEQYLEIGTWLGGSLRAALLDNEARAQVIDPLHHSNVNGSIYDQWKKNTSAVADRVNLHREFCQNFGGTLPQIGVFYYDGNHDAGHTYEGLRKFSPFLADQAIIVVDDYHIFKGDDPFPGYANNHDYPVEADVQLWIKENIQNVKDWWIAKWFNWQAIILFERN